MVQACLNGTRPREAHAAVPISPYQLARDARAVADVGVRSVHVHPRCALGRETIEEHHVGDVVAAIRSAVPAMEVAVPSARWVQPDPRRRVETVTGWGRLGWAKPDVVAVSVGELGWRELCAAACRLGIGIELGVWTPADAIQVRRAGLPAGVLRVVAEVTVSDPIIAVGEATRILRTLGRVEVPVLLHGEDTSAWPVWEYATRMGLHSRIGLEDTLTCPDGSPTTGNTDLVERAQRLGRRLRTQSGRLLDLTSYRLLPRRLDDGRVELGVDGDGPSRRRPLREALFAPTLQQWSGVEFDRPDLICDSDT